MSNALSFNSADFHLVMVASRTEDSTVFCRRTPENSVEKACGGLRGHTRSGPLDSNLTYSTLAPVIVANVRKIVHHGKASL
ncbi:hypothetical protein PILCRDRAFT_811546 [Piloderma croceum F 1598]|uniref:Uncharacterized protein n=1 Tax=Piloderma croceum (strain F 1598) TaxID=765440 RepID=A0A0C3GK78_PILCF|nr:hypothetical protein PILCRDRAFT_811546 [Piloderma croceum F 1598]